MRCRQRREHTDMRRESASAVFRYCLAYLALSAAQACVAADRIWLEGTNASVIPADGWQQEPASSDPPMLSFYFCGMPVEAGTCLVRAEFAFSRLNEARAPKSLDALMAASTGHASETVKATRTKAGGFDAVESVSEATAIYDGHDANRKPVAMHRKELVEGIILHADGAFYECTLRRVAASEDASALLSQLREFCSSIQLSSATPG